MTRYKHKMTASVPALRRDAVNAELNRILGCGPDTFHIPCETGRGVVSRYGTQWLMTAAERDVLKEVLGRVENQGDVKEGERIEDHAVRLGLMRRRKNKKQARR